MANCTLRVRGPLQAQLIEGQKLYKAYPGLAIPTKNLATTKTAHDNKASRRRADSRAQKMKKASLAA